MPKCSFECLLLLHLLTLAYFQASYTEEYMLYLSSKSIIRDGRMTYSPNGFVIMTLV